MDKKENVEKIRLCELADKLVKNSKLTKKDVLEFSRKINAAATKRFMAKD